MTRPTLASFKKKALKDPAVREEYEALSPAYDLRRKLIALRKAAGLTQEELAERFHWGAPSPGSSSRRKI